MGELRIHFLDNSYGEDGRLAARVLAECLNRQGLENRVEDGVLHVSAPTRRATDPSEVYVVLDETLLNRPSLLGQIDRKTGVVVCSARPARTLQHELGRFTAGVTAVDASGIGMHEGADPVMAMLGGAARMLPWIDRDMLSSSVWAVYDNHLPYAAHAALRAFDQGYAQAQLAQ